VKAFIHAHAVVEEALQAHRVARASDFVEGGAPVGVLGKHLDGRRGVLAAWLLCAQCLGDRPMQIAGTKPEGRRPEPRSRVKTRTGLQEHKHIRPSAW
jgi:hypothetical protein